MVLEFIGKLEGSVKYFARKCRFSDILKIIVEDSLLIGQVVIIYG